MRLPSMNSPMIFGLALAVTAGGCRIEPTTRADEVPLAAENSEFAGDVEVRAPGVVPDPDAADVESIDSIVAALYGVISGPEGEPRDWTRFRSLFVEDARLIPSGRARGVAYIQALTPEEYIERAGPSLEQGFFEREIARTTERFGDIAHVFSTYESRRQETDAEPFDRGINSIQLFRGDDGWRIVTIFWTAETEDMPIPEEYLPDQ